MQSVQAMSSYPGLSLLHSNVENRVGEETDLAAFGAQNHALSELCKTILTLRDLVLADQAPGFQASQEIKERLRSSNLQYRQFDHISPQSLDLVSGIWRNTVSLRADASDSVGIAAGWTAAQNPPAHIADGGLMSLDPPLRFIAGHESEEEDNIPDVLKPGESTTFYSYDPDEALRLASTFLMSVQEMQSKYQDFVAGEDDDQPPTTLPERYAYFHDYYASNSEKDGSMASDDAEDEEETWLHPTVHPKMETSVAGLELPAAAELPSGTQGATTADLEAIFRALQQTIPAAQLQQSPPPQPPPAVSGMEPVSGESGESDYEPVVGTIEQADEYDPQALEIESEYEPTRPQPRYDGLHSYVNASSAKANVIAAPQPARPTNNAVTRMDSSHQRTIPTTNRNGIDKSDKKSRKQRNREERERKKAIKDEKRRGKQAARPSPPRTQPSIAPSPVQPLIPQGYMMPPPSAYGAPPPPPPPFGQVVPHGQPAYPSRAPTAAPYFGMPPQQPSARMLAPGEATIVYDQFGNAFYARPVEPQHPPAHAYPY